MAETIGSPTTVFERSLPPADRAATIGYSLGTRTDTNAPVVANTGSAYAIDPTRSQVFDLTATANTVVLACTPTGAIPAGQSIRVRLRQDATAGRRITYPANWSWNGNVWPNLQLAAGSVVEIVAVTYDGTTWLCSTPNGGPIAGADPRLVPNLVRAWEATPGLVNLADAAAVGAGWLDTLASAAMTTSASVAAQTRRAARPGRVQHRVADFRTAAQDASTPVVGGLLPVTGFTAVFGWNPVTWGGSGSYIYVQNVGAINWLIGMSGASPNGVLYGNNGAAFQNSTNITTVVADQGIIPVSIRWDGTNPVEVYWDDTLVTWTGSMNPTATATSAGFNQAGGGGGTGTGDASNLFLASVALPAQDVAGLRAWIRADGGRR
jgi:hypothetical protein